MERFLEYFPLLRSLPSSVLQSLRRGRVVDVSDLNLSRDLRVTLSGLFSNIMELDKVQEVNKKLLNKVGEKKYQGFDPKVTRNQIVKATGFSSEEHYGHKEQIWKKDSGFDHRSAEEVQAQIKSERQTNRERANCEFSKSCSFFSRVFFNIPEFLPIDRIHRPLDLTEFKEIIADEFHPLFTTNILASMLPTDDKILTRSDANKICVMILTYNTMETPILNPEFRSKSFKECWLHNKDYLLASYRSSLFDNNQKFKTLSVLTEIFTEEDGTLELKDKCSESYENCVKFIASKDKGLVTKLIIWALGWFCSKSFILFYFILFLNNLV